jgi:predicted AAA+ superfamily ATPase
MIKRPEYINKLSKAIKRSPVTALLGPRQCGKTTLVRQFSSNKNAAYFDLESQQDLNRLQNPELVLGSMDKLVIIDEIQVLPELFKVLRVVVDHPDNKARFIILGSASPHIIKNVSETLAGRIEFIELNCFNLGEVGSEQMQRLWIQGGFPLAFLAEPGTDSIAWREGFIRTFLERDIPQLGISIPSPAMRRFWTMLANYHGRIWNASQLARSMGLSDKTVRSYLDILTGTYMVRQLQPWYENIKKRQVKAPKIYLRDSGLLHNLLNLPDMHALSSHPGIGPSWEGFCIEQILHTINPSQAYFWSTHSGAEIDLFFIRKGKRFGVEIKFSEAPKVSKSLFTAIDDLGLEHVWIVYPGKEHYPVHEKISVIPLKDIPSIGTTSAPSQLPQSPA